MFSSSFVIFASLVLVKSAKILVVVPTPSIGHQIVFRSLIEELVNRDHEVTVLTPDPVYPQGNSPETLTELDVHDLTYKIWNQVYESFGKKDQEGASYIASYSIGLLHDIFYNQLQDKSVQKLIRDKTVKFDLLILEECVISTLIFSYLFKAPVIQMSSLGDSRDTKNAIGALAHPFLYPTHFHQRIYNLTIWEKLTELHNHVLLKWRLENLELQDDTRMPSLFGIDTPILSELKNNIDVLFLNVHSLWLHNQPDPLNIVYNWGLHKTPKGVLSEDLQTYLDSSENGVIYISFGSNFKTSSLDPEILKIFLNVFSRLPYNILWKWDMDELPGKSDNIKISKWFPQCDILRHPNLKLFITHGGLQSTEEAIDAGVPLVGFPLFIDQDYNTEKYLYFKIGIQLHFSTLTIDKLENAIKMIFANYDSYRDNISHLKTQMQDQPKSPLENTIWWIEYVLRHGGARHLRSPAANMSWAEYYELELLLVILSGIIVLITVIILLLQSCCKLLFIYDINIQIANFINNVVKKMFSKYEYKIVESHLKI